MQMVGTEREKFLEQLRTEDLTYYFHHKISKENSNCYKKLSKKIKKDGPALLEELVALSRKGEPQEQIFKKLVKYSKQVIKLQDENKYSDDKYNNFFKRDHELRKKLFGGDGGPDTKFRLGNLQAHEER